MAQVRAACCAACSALLEGVPVRLSVALPLVGTVQELRVLVEDVRRVAADVAAEYCVELPVRVGAVIDVPRAALAASDIAQVRRQPFLRVACRSQVAPR